jgi:SAM-dependent methyltransferase
MTSPDSSRPADGGAKFDAYANEYQSLHQKSIAASGESPTYFSEYKLHCLERLVGPKLDEPVLDFGCGIGNVTEQLVKRFSEVEGYDPSRDSLRIAKGRAPAAVFRDDLASVRQGVFGVVVLSGVLHHVKPQERRGLFAAAVARARPSGGRVVVFEHNPYNPLTRKAVRDCPFDDDAILLRPREIVLLLRSAGLSDVRCRFIVFFPRKLSILRPLEPMLAALPFGAQTMTVGVRG